MAHRALKIMFVFNTADTSRFYCCLVYSVFSNFCWSASLKLSLISRHRSLTSTSILCFSTISSHLSIIYHHFNHLPFATPTVDHNLFFILTRTNHNSTCVTFTIERNIFEITTHHHQKSAVKSVCSELCQTKCQPLTNLSLCYSG